MGRRKRSRRPNFSCSCVRNPSFPSLPPFPVSFQVALAAKVERVFKNDLGLRDFVQEKNKLSLFLPSVPWFVLVSAWVRILGGCILKLGLKNVIQEISWVSRCTAMIWKSVWSENRPCRKKLFFEITVGTAGIFGRGEGTGMKRKNLRSAERKYWGKKFPHRLDLQGEIIWTRQNDRDI